MKILITGATGLIGSALTDHLLQNGHEVVHLSRSPRQGKVKTYVWDVPNHTMDREALKGVNAVVHLAGAGVADKPWTEKRKTEIVTSRTQTAALLYDQIKAHGKDVETFVSASGANYYGTDDGSRVFREDDPPGKDFLSQVSQAWESEAEKFRELGKRVVMLRIGMVISSEGGALTEFVKPIKWYAGAPLGSGKQYISWIHITDLCRLFTMAIEDRRLAGPYNATAPHPVTNKAMMYAVAGAMGKPILLPPVPAFVLRLLLGEMAYLVLEGNRVSPQKAIDAGFQFQFGTLEEALADIFSLPHR